MNANEITNNAFINRIGIEDTDRSLDGSKTFADIKEAVVKAINTIDTALPKMKEARIDMKKASFDAEGLFRSIVRKGWGSNEVDFYVTLRGNKAITGVDARTLDDIVKQISEYVLNY